jgi:Protein of unknown function (DUF2711)
MDYSRFAYPSHQIPLLRAYDGRFKGAFIALHPFFRMPVSDQWQDLDDSYPDSILIRKYGQAVDWKTIMQGIDCKDLRSFYIGMRTSINALREEYEDKEMARLISDYIDQTNIYRPTEGMIESLMVEAISTYISHGQSEKILYLAEFQEVPEEFSCESLIQKCDDNFLRGSFFDVGVTRLVTVDWDDFFTVFYSSNKQIDFFQTHPVLEGFFCDGKTSHNWCRESRAVKPAV